MAVLARKFAWSPKLVQTEGASPEVGWLSIPELHFGDYQRTLDEARVKKIVDNYDPHLIGTILVARRSDGSLWVIDGQHRVAALRLLGHSVVLATVYADTTDAGEALLFVAANSNRGPPNQWEKFRARL